MMHRTILIVDALINLILGLLLVFFPPAVVEWLGVPPTDQPFYASVLGGVLIGIALALLVEIFRSPGGLIGLGLGGAISINLCGGAVLAIWLLGGGLDLPLRGRVFLWGLVGLLVGVSLSELLAHLAARRAATRRP